MRSALTWAIEQQDAGAALEMCAAVSDYWLMRDRYADGVHWIDQVLGMPGADAHPAPRVRTLCFKARCVWTLGRAAEEPAVLADLEATARGLADPAIVAHALSVRADREAFHGRFDAANRLADEAYAAR